MQLRCGIKNQKLRYSPITFTCNYEYDSSTMLQVYINGNSSCKGGEHAYVNSYCSIVQKTTAKI